MNIFSKIIIIAPVIFLSFFVSEVSAATYSLGGGITVYGDQSGQWITSTSTPCGIGLKWDLKLVQGYPPTLMQDQYKEEATVSIYRSTNSNVSPYNGTHLFTGTVVTVPSYSDYGTTSGGSSIPAYIFKYTDLTAVPGVTYYYYISSNGTRSSYTTFTSHPSLITNFQRPSLQISDLKPYESGSIPFSWSYRNGYYYFSNSCPFVNTPGSGGSFATSQDPYLNSYNYISLVDYALGDSLGGPIANLQCTEDKYAFSKARDTGHFYGFRLIDHNYIYNDHSEIRNIYGQAKTQSSGQVTGRLSNVWSDPEKFDITKTGATSYAFYREVCDEGDYFTYHTGCSLEKITDPSEYTIEEIYDDGLFSVSFNNENYTPPAGKNYYGYYVTSVNQYGAESWPFGLGGVSYFDEIQGGNGKLPTCYKCLNPNTINQSEVFPLINIATAKNLKWDTTNQKLIQESANQNDTNQQWYIRPSGDQNYVNIVSVSNNKALATNGYIDWSWQTFFDSYENGPNFPGFVMNYETLDSGYSYGYMIGQDIVDQNDDSQKWCIYKTTIDSSYGSLSNELEPGPTILGLDNIIVDAYVLINKATQSTLKVSSYLYAGDYMAPNLNNGALVWLDLYSNNSATYGGGPSGWPPVNFLDETWLINLPTESLSCTGPQGEIIQSGQNLTYYEANTTLQYYDPLDPSGADHCSDYAITASCNNGVLSSFKYSDG
ncbi:MAG: RICIN domain-containing protein, partial [Melioribacteraceae bacterium]|nr:RICIN domain-containing protein [Melioribacteraceae bacterium]